MGSKLLMDEMSMKENGKFLQIHYILWALYGRSFNYQKPISNKDITNGCVETPEKGIMLQWHIRWIFVEFMWKKNSWNFTVTREQVHLNGVEETGYEWLYEA